MAEHQFIPVAAWYGGGKARAPMLARVGPDSLAQWRKDIEAIRAAGFNTVRCWIDWTTGEPSPGQFDFRTVDTVMDLAAQAGLKIILQVYLDAAPDWMDGMFPEAKYTSQSGHKVESQGSPGFCYDHPGVRSTAERFLRALAGHVKDRPNFLGWDIWSEPHITNWAYIDYLTKPVVFCYCHYSVQRFQDWLQRRYGDIETLNRVWYRSFPHFRSVNAPRFSTLQNYAEFIDWQLFLTDKLAEDLGWRAQVVKAVDPDHVVASHAGSPSILNMPLLHNGEPDDWKMAHSVDVWGTSIYPHHYVTGEPWDAVTRSAAIAGARCSAHAAGKPFWLGELQGGLGYVGLKASTPVTPEDVRLWGWEAIGQGAKGICYYAYYPMNCGFESNGFGLVYLDGTDTGRMKAAGSVGAEIQRYQELFSNAYPVPAQVGILYDVLSNIQWSCMRDTDPEVPRAANLGIYRALYDENIEADYVHLSDIEQGMANRYKVIHIPLGIMLSEKAAAGLVRFVEEGGTLIAEARVAWNNEHGWVDEVGVPGYGLERVFGCREIYVEGKSIVEIRPSGAPPIRGVRWAQHLVPLDSDAEVIATFDDGSPACIAHRAGRGRGILIGTLLSAAYELHRDTETARWMVELIKSSGVQPRIQVTANAESKPHVYVLQADTAGGLRRVLVVTNPSARTVHVQLQMSGILPSDHAAMSGVVLDLADGRPVPATRHDGKLTLALQMAPKEPRVFLWTLSR